MSAQLWEVAVWIGGTVGVVGFIAAWILFPAVFGVVLKGIMAMFGFVLSYRIGCALVAAIVMGFAVDYWRHDRDNTAFAAKTAAFEQAQAARDKRIAAETREQVRLEIAAEPAKVAVEEKEAKEFTDVVAPLPAGDVIDRVGNDYGRLCELSGKAGCGSPVRKRVSKPPRKSVSPPFHPDDGISGFIRRRFGSPETGKPSH